MNDESQPRINHRPIILGCLPFIAACLVVIKFMLDETSRLDIFIARFTLLVQLFVPLLIGSIVVLWVSGRTLQRWIAALAGLLTEMVIYAMLVLQNDARLAGCLQMYDRAVCGETSGQSYLIWAGFLAVNAIGLIGLSLWLIQKREPG